MSYSVDKNLSVLMCSEAPAVLHAVLEVGRDEAGWHPISFRKAPKPSLCLLTGTKSSHHLFSRFETTLLLFSSVKPLLALLLFCTNSNVHMQRMAIMKELNFTILA
jgi:hypothetical protein